MIFIVVTLIDIMTWSLDRHCPYVCDFEAWFFIVLPYVCFEGWFFISLRYVWVKVLFIIVTLLWTLISHVHIGAYFIEFHLSLSFSIYDLRFNFWIIGLPILIDFSRENRNVWCFEIGHFWGEWSCEFVTQKEIYNGFRTTCIC